MDAEWGHVRAEAAAHGRVATRYKSSPVTLCILVRLNHYGVRRLALRKRTTLSQRRLAVRVTDPSTALGADVQSDVLHQCAFSIESAVSHQVANEGVERESAVNVLLRISFDVPGRG